MKVICIRMACCVRSRPGICARSVSGHGVYNLCPSYAMHCTANSPPTNWMGAFGSLNSYLFFSLLGLCAYLIPLFFLFFGGLMASGHRLRYKVLWMLIATISCSVLLQFANGTFLSLLESPRFNLAPNSGGGIGFLLKDKLLPWLGAGCMSLFIILLRVNTDVYFHRRL